MAYATQTNLEDRLGSDLLALLADEDGDGAGDASILAAALDDASAEIDAALAGRYATPVATPPAILLRLTVDIAVYFLFTRRREAIAPEHVARWKEARVFLDRIARGETDLDGAQERLSRMKTESSTREQARRFDRDALDSF